MKVFYSLLLALVVSSGPAFAQRAITFADFPYSGQSIDETRETPESYATSVETEVRKSGNNQTWDFSNAPTTGQISRDTTTYLDPATTPYFDLFPNATHAEQDDDSTYSYTLANAQRIESLGSANPSTLVRNSGQVSFIFPMNFGQGIDNEFESLTIIRETEDTTTVTGRWQADYQGYGTFRLPQGTFADVVQLRVRITIDTPFGDFLSEIFLFRQLDSKVDVANYVKPPQGESSFEFTTATPTSRKSPTEPVVLALSPNPTNGRFNLTYVQRETSPLTIEVVDLLGRTVLTQTQAGSVGLQQLQLDLDAPAGVYTVVVRSASGSTAQKLILN